MQETMGWRHFRVIQVRRFAKALCSCGREASCLWEAGLCDALKGAFTKQALCLS